MIKKHYTGMERRAENIIWNAAGRYDFDAPFMSFLENGSPDLYFNMIIGLSFKWLDMERISDFFNRYGGYHKAEEFDELLWIGIENCIYEKEIPSRPVMKKLREKRADEFFLHRQTLSRQQMMLQSMLVYDQQEARWNQVLGRKEHLLTGREKKLEELLLFPGDLDTDGVIRRMEETLQRIFHYTVPAETDTASSRRKKGGAGSVMRKLLRREDHYRDTLIVRNGTSEGDEEGAAQIARGTGEQKSVSDYEADLAYIKESLGDSVISGKELRTLENNLCKGAHAYCRLWVSRGRMRGSEEQSAEVNGKNNVLSTRDVRDLDAVHKSQKAQDAKNRKWLRDHHYLISSGIRRLSMRMDETLSDYEQSLPEEAKAGKLRQDIAYRLPVLRDPDVFLRPGDEKERSISIDLLLDASASRLNYQEQLASEAYVIAQSCIRAKIPVQVSCFRSLRGFTALQVLKDRKSRDCEHILSYTAGGWNRDGLGLRMAASLMPEKTDVKLRILLVLTDASPNDSTRVPPEAGGVLEHEYQGRTAVLDARDAVADIRKEGIMTAAVFLGPTLYMENLHTIYGKEYVRIHKIEQLEEGIASLLEMILREQK